MTHSPQNRSSTCWSRQAGWGYVLSRFHKAPWNDKRIEVWWGRFTWLLQAQQTWKTYEASHPRAAENRISGMQVKGTKYNSAGWPFTPAMVQPWHNGTVACGIRHTKMHTDNINSTHDISTKFVMTRNTSASLPGSSPFGRETTLRRTQPIARASTRNPAVEHPG